MVKPESGSSINKRTVSADGQRLLRGLVRCTVHWKRPWCWEGLGAGREGDDRGWDGWMASLTQWTWVWVNSGSWWWRGRPGVLQFMELQRVRHDWATELNWTELCSAWPRGIGEGLKMKYKKQLNLIHQRKALRTRKGKTRINYVILN